MKSILLFIITSISLSTIATAQSDKLASGDSIRIELERAALGKNLIDLRDSISVSLLNFAEKIKKSKPSEIVTLAAAHKELSAYKDQLDLDIEEVSQTAVNSWTDHAQERIQLATLNARRNYKRIITLL